MLNNKNTINRTANNTIAISVALFLLALTQQCYCTADSCADSILVFIFGWLGVFLGGSGIAWLANPFIVCSWFFTKKKQKYALPCSMLATFFCLLFLCFSTVVVNEAGHFRAITGIAAGYWLWLSSAASMLLGNLLLKYGPAANSTGEQ
jgi:hypothetical protein